MTEKFRYQPSEENTSYRINRSEISVALELFGRVLLLLKLLKTFTVVGKLLLINSTSVSDPYSLNPDPDPAF